jgi:hypothetical protein
VVNNSVVSVYTERGIQIRRPRFSPILRAVLLVPIDGWDFSAVDGFRFLPPRSVFFNRAHGEHDMSMGIAVIFVVYADVGAHPGVDESIFCEPAGKGYVLLPREFDGQGYFNLPRQLSGFVTLGFFHLARKQGGRCGNGRDKNTRRFIEF